MINGLINRLRIRMVERYLAGRMPDRESRRFHQRLDADPRLRQLLQEEKTIEKALLHDRDSIPVMGTQRLERMLKGQAGPASGGTPSYHATGGNGGMWPSPNLSRLQRLADWLTRREALVAISAIGSVGVALVLYSLADSRGKPLEAPTASPPSSAATAATVPDTTPVMSLGIVPEHDSLVHPHRTDSAAVLASHDTAPGVARTVPEVQPEADSMMWIPLHPAEREPTRPDTGMSPVQVRMDNAPDMRKAYVKPLDSADLMRLYLEKEARRMGRKVDSSDSVKLNFQMKDR